MASAACARIHGRDARATISAAVFVVFGCQQQINGAQYSLTPLANVRGQQSTQSQIMAELSTTAEKTINMSQQETKIETPDDEAGRLRQQLAEQESKIDEVAELVSRVRHEINNPLTGILGQAQLLLREELNDKARKRAETIERLAQRLATTVAELRLVQKPVRTAATDENQKEPEPEP